MHKCPNCSCEYEGKFCPNCGTPWQEEKTCPSCGAKLNGSARFCNECGFSFYKAAEQVQEEKPKTGFKEKLRAAGAWVKSHLKIVIPSATALVLVLILSIAIPVGVKNKTNGTYYQLKGGELDKKTYFILKSGSWEDEDGETGTYKKDGDKITFYAEFFGETEEITTGTLKDKVLTVDGKSYVSEKHKHSYGEWETTKEPTCKADGLKTRSCTCGVKETDILLATGNHSFIDGKCTFCGTIQPTQGLEYELNGNRQSYYVSDIGTANATNILIPSSYNGKPVTSIGSRAFYKCSGLTSITIPDSVTSIGDDAFRGCSGLTSIIIPDSVTSIGDDAFRSCSGLTSIIIPDSVTRIGESAFNSCHGLTSVTIGNSVTCIGYYEFYNCSGLTSITIPDGVTSIDERAFCDCSGLTSITIPDSVRSIGDLAFEGCRELTEINYSGTMEEWRSIEKGYYWNYKTGNYTVHCSDGDIG